MLTEIEQRQRVIDEAMTWLHTPYHHMGRVKGAGVDCAMFLCEVYEKSGITSFIDVDFYPNDWALHQDEERYLKTILKYSYLVSRPQKGDMILYRFGRVASHSAIITDYPNVIHCYRNVGVIEDYDGSNKIPLHRRVGIFSPWGKE